MPWGGGGGGGVSMPRTTCILVDGTSGHPRDSRIFS